MSSAGRKAVVQQGAVEYQRGSFSMIPKRLLIGGKLAVRGYTERNKTELSHRSYKPQKHYFQVDAPPTYERDHMRAHNQFYNLETKLIWKAFDAPELIGMLLHDETIRGHEGLYDESFLDAAEHWLVEARYWRCIGISKPFFNKDMLRVHCWEDNGTQTGTLRLSAAMRHALMDLERAVRRRDLGLDANYVWDKWGPNGMIDGSRADYIPRFVQNPYIDPDGVDITELDVAPFNTHEQIRERYWDFIAPNTDAVEGCFMTIGHGPLQLEDLPSQAVRDLYQKLNPTAVARRDGSISIAPDDMRLLMYLSSAPELLEQLGDVSTWTDVVQALQEVTSANNTLVDAARLLNNTRHEEERVRRYYEEKCGMMDFMNTGDKEITAAAISYVRSLRSIATNPLTQALPACLSDYELFQAMGKQAYHAYRLTEDLILDKRRRQWATRFAGEANEEASLDYLLENFGRRKERMRNQMSVGGEFDRETEPIGRNVQRRVLDSDKKSSLAEARKSKGRIFNRKRDAVSNLHQKQLQNAMFGIK